MTYRWVFQPRFNKIESRILNSWLTIEQTKAKLNQQFNIHLVLSHSYELIKDITAPKSVNSITRHSHRFISIQTDKLIKQQAVHEKTVGTRALQIANRRGKYARTQKQSAIKINWKELTEAIDFRSICGWLLRQTRINTDRFKQLSNMIKIMLDRYLKNRTTRERTERLVTPLFTCGTPSSL